MTERIFANFSELYATNTVTQNMATGNMSPTTHKEYRGNPVYTHISEQGHGGKLEPAHVEVKLQDYSNGSVKVWFKDNDTIELADKDARVPQWEADAFVRFCKDNKEDLQQHIKDQYTDKLNDSTQVSYKHLGDQYDGKTIPKSSQESGRKQKRKQNAQQPDEEQHQ